MAGTITGKHVIYDATLSVNGVVLTTRLEQVSFRVGINDQVGAAMGDIQDYSIPGTLTVSDPTAQFYMDYAAANVYATLRALQAARTVFNIVGKASSSATSAENPEFTIPVFVKDMPLLDASRGDRHMANVTFKVAGELTIATS